jgi:choline dehydrogenase-like flavoprotein
VDRQPLTRIFDAIVVGSGATGGWAAKKLSEGGLDVALLEAGRPVSAAEFPAQMPSYKVHYWNPPQDILRTRPIQRTCYACMESNHEWFVDDREHPYSTADGMPFTWHRLRILGGRTLVWAGQSYRFSALDFKAAAADGYGVEWPLDYDELAPYYDEVEEYVGISGSAEGHAALPDGRFLPAMNMTCGEVLLRDCARARFGYTVTIGRTAVLTREHRGRAACRYCGPCERGCQTFSYFSSPFTTVADALRSGRCTLMTNAIVARVEMDSETNRARGVTCVDRLTRQSYEVRGRTIVLCAQALESTRILLNSATRAHPRGLGNSSGTLGRYLMDHPTGAGAIGRLPWLDARTRASQPYRPNGIYTIRFRNLPGDDPHPEFIRGYAFQGSALPMFDFGAPGLGVAYKEAVKQGIYPIWLGACGESLPRFENYCEIDPDLCDAWGIPALRVHMTHGDNERHMMRDAATTAADMLEATGARDIVVNTHARTPGTAIHEVGTARMGADPRTSVLDRFNQLHDVRNVFLMDGGCFVSSGCQNPTLTMMALAVRGCDALLERFRRGDV